MEILKSLEIYPIILLNDLLRYLIAAGIAYLIFWVIGKEKWRRRIIQERLPKLKKMWMEFRYSMSTVFIFSLVGLCIHFAEQAGYTRIYAEARQYGWPYLILSLFLMILMHDTYFYWTHRLMHHPKVFRHIHLVHHRSTNPSPWAAYSFHPLEAIIEAGIFPLIVFTIPVHPIAIFSFLLFMIARNVQGHLGIEFLPHWFIRSQWINWNTTTVHHDLHHERFDFNYGLYFTWWDKWFGTEHPEYKEHFEQVTSRKEEMKAMKLQEAAKKSMVVLALVGCSLPLIGQSPEGLWQTFHEQTGRPLSLIRIEPTPSGLAGKIEKIYLQAWEGNDPICTKCPGSKAGKKVVGMEFLWGFSRAGKSYTDGTILDPASGETYNSKMWLDDDQTLKVRGYGGPLGLFYRTQTWQLIEDHPDDNPYTGRWKTIDDESALPKSEVHLYEKDGQLAGKILKIYLMPWEGENPICRECPEEKKDKPIVGMNMLWGFSPEGPNHWSGGHIMDPGNGRTYSSSLWLEEDDKLKVRGYLGPFFRTQIWKRAGS